MEALRSLQPPRLNIITSIIQLKVWHLPPILHQVSSFTSAHTPKGREFSADKNKQGLALQNRFHVIVPVPRA